MISEPILAECKCCLPAISTNSFNHSVITMKTLKEGTQKRVSAFITWIHFTTDCFLFLRRDLAVSFDTLLSLQLTQLPSARLLRLSEENTKTPLLHKPGNCNEKNISSRWKREAMENSVGED